MLKSIELKEDRDINKEYSNVFKVSVQAEH